MIAQMSAQPYPLIVVDSRGFNYLVIGWTGQTPDQPLNRPEDGPWPVVVPLGDGPLAGEPPRILPLANIAQWRTEVEA